MRKIITTIAFAIPFLLLLFIPLWPDPDATGTFNLICRGTQPNFLLPLSEIVFKAIPCDIIIWKFFQIILLVSILYLFSRHYPLSVLGLVGFFPVFLLTFEDDLFAFPFLFLYWIMIQNPTWPQAEQPPQYYLMLYRRLRWVNEYSGFRRKLFLLIVGAGLTILLGTFVWKGAFLIGLILLAYVLHPALSIIPSVIHLLIGQFNTWGGSSEATIGFGFLGGQIGLLLLLYFFWKNGFVWKKEYWLLLSLEILVFFQPKWGEWLILPFAVLLVPLLKDFRINFFGYWMLVLLVVFTLLTAFPTSNDTDLIKHVVALQKEGNLVYTDWGVGYYFEHYGGKPSQKGGYPDFQDVNGGYWLGGDRDKTCSTILRSDSLFFQSC